MTDQPPTPGGCEGARPEQHDRNGAEARTRFLATIPPGEVSFEAVAALLRAERAALAQLANPAQAARAEARAAAIADLAKRAKLAVPIQNEATLLRLEALAQMAVLVAAGQAAGDLASAHRPAKASGQRTLAQLGIDRRRLAEGRSIANSTVLEEARVRAQRQPDAPLSIKDLLQQASRAEREDRKRTERQQREAEAQAAISASDDPLYKLHHGSLEHWRPTGVAAVVTDAPYLDNCLPLYRALRDFAVEVLPPGGALAVMTSPNLLAEVFRALDHERLVFRWQFIWRYANGQQVTNYQSRVHGSYKPILLFYADHIPSETRFFRDEILSSGPDKDHHPWGQSVTGFERLIEALTEPGELVCDPFLGGGTTAIAALAQNRRFVGCDIDRSAIETTRSRLAA